MWDEPSANDTNCPTHENSKWQTIREKVWWATGARLYPASPVITTNFPKESKTFSSSLTICYCSVFLDKNTETQRHGVLFSFKQSKAYKSSIRRLMNKTQWPCVSLPLRLQDNKWSRPNKGKIGYKRGFISHGIISPQKDTVSVVPAIISEFLP